MLISSIVLPGSIRLILAGSSNIDNDTALWVNIGKIYSLGTKNRTVVKCSEGEKNRTVVKMCEWNIEE